MPSLLKRDTIKLLEGGIECYVLSLHGVSVPDLRFRRSRIARYAPVIGLLGSSVELVLKAILVQAKGTEIVVRNDGFYRFGSELMEDIRKGIREEDPDFAFLWSDTEDPDAVRTDIYDYCLKFKILQTLRASGLHAGVGPSRDVVLIAFTDVYGFIQALSQSRRMSPYFRSVPVPETPVVSRAAIIEDLSRRLSRDTGLEERAGLLKSMYLVLPHVPEVEPPWLSAFERVSVTPSEDDVAYLLETLSDAHGVHLLKQRGGGDGLPVVVEPGNPHALPISVQFLKRELTQISDQFYADIASANGRLRNGILDLPPDDFILDLFTIGFENTPVCRDEGFRLTAQETWPFVSSAISVQGTPRPYWFIVKYCDELQKLLSMLEDVMEYANAYCRKRLEEVDTGIRCIVRNQSWPDHHPIYSDVEDSMLRYSRPISDLSALLQTDLAKELQSSSPELFADLKRCSTEGERIGAIVEKALNTLPLDEGTGKELVRALAPFCYRYEDRGGLLAILRTDELSRLHTVGRKLCRVIDCTKFGPDLKGVRGAMQWPGEEH